jgi:pilus assembly protein CpaF
MGNFQPFQPSDYQKVKAALHRKILDRLDLEKLGKTSGDSARDEVLAVIRSAVNAEAVPLSHSERERLSREILDEIFGLGPLEQLLKDGNVSDILVNRFDRVYVEKAGKLELTTLAFKDNGHLMQIIERIVSRVGRRVDESSPMVDARLADGSRVNAIIPPLALEGPCLSIRRFGRDPVTARQMIENKTLTEPMLELLSAMVKGRLNILVSGGTGAGKTTLLNVLSGYIPHFERIVTIEDAAELQLKQENIVRLETRPPNIEGKGAVRQRQLVINSLRMRPDRIVVGEVRGEEAFDMLQAMNTGHEGSLTTVHANSPRDAMARIENMVSMANLNIPERAVRQQIASAVHAVVQIARLSDGTRKVITISEVTGMADDAIAMQDIFIFERTGINESGKVRGMFRATGVRPQFADRLATAGARLRPALFESGRQMLDSSTTDEGPEEADTAGIAVKKPRSPNLNSGSAAASLNELFG